MGIIKALVIIAIAGAAFYLFYPKYDFPAPDRRCNRITGRVEVFRQGEWQPAVRRQQPEPVQQLSSRAKDLAEVFEKEDILEDLGKKLTELNKKYDPEVEKVLKKLKELGDDIDALVAKQNVIKRK